VKALAKPIWRAPWYRPTTLEALPHEALDVLARASFRPVGLAREEVVNGVDVDPCRVVVELDPVFQLSSHLRLKR
jgi:hypothetical protein